MHLFSVIPWQTTICRRQIKFLRCLGKKIFAERVIYTSIVFLSALSASSAGTNNRQRQTKISSVTTHTWHKIAESIAEINFSANGLTEIELKGKKICLGLHNNTLFACTQKCPHAGGILSEGSIDAAGHLVCPLHHYKFNIKNGYNVSGEGFFLKTYPVKVLPDGVYADINHLFH